jgi:hypothetical protein
LKNLFGAFTRRVLAEMETMCFNSLPKLSEAKTKKEVEDQVVQFLICLPKLKYCENHTERYLIGTLDAIVKSIK